MGVCLRIPHWRKIGSLERHPGKLNFRALDAITVSIENMSRTLVLLLVTQSHPTFLMALDAGIRFSLAPLSCALPLRSKRRPSRWACSLVLGEYYFLLIPNFKF
jgi:hypothetical protein